MREVFLEEVSTNSNFSKEKLEYNLFTILSILAFVFFGVWVFFSLFYLISLLKSSIFIKIIIIILPSAMFLVFGLIFNKIRYNFCIEYDYTLVVDSVRVDKVVKGVKRFPVVEFVTNDVEKIGKFGSDTYNKYLERIDLTIEFLSPNDNPAVDKDFYYVVVNLNADKIIYVFECTKNFIANILYSSKKGVLESDFK